MLPKVCTKSNWVSKMQFFSSSWGHINPHTPPCPRKRGTWCWCSTLVTAFTALPPPSWGKQPWICLCLSLVPFMLSLIKENVYTKYDLRKFVIVSGVCIKIRTCRSEKIFLTYLQSYNDVFHNASNSTGGGGLRATFFNSEGAEINDSRGPPGVRPPGYAPAETPLNWISLRSNSLVNWTLAQFDKLFAIFEALELTISRSDFMVKVGSWELKNAEMGVLQTE